MCLLQTNDCLPGQLLLVLSGQRTEDSVHLLLKLGAIESSRSNCRDEQNCACPLTSLGPSRLLPTVASPFPEQAHLNGPFRWLVVMAQCQHGRHRGGSLKKKKREKTRPSSEHTERLVIRHSISGYFFCPGQGQQCLCAVVATVLTAAHRLREYTRSKVRPKKNSFRAKYRVKIRNSNRKE